MITIATLLGAGTLNLAMAVAVYLTNPGRSVNRAFFLLGVHLAAWTEAALLAASAGTAGEAAAWLRLEFALGALLPASLAVLYQAIRHEPDTLREPLLQVWPLILGGIILAGVTFSGGVVDLENAGASLLQGGGIRYGPLLIPYLACLAAVAVWGILRFRRDYRLVSGIRQAELQYLAAGTLAAVTVGAALLPLSSGTAAVRLPLASAAMNLILAYGIATRNIMNVAQLIRRVFSYLLLTLSLVGVYAGVYLVVAWAQLHGGGHADWLPSLVAALAVAISMTPAHGVMRRLAHRLLISSREVNVARALTRASAILHTVSTVDRLLSRFADLLRDAFEADHVAVLVRDGNAFIQIHPPQPREDQPFLRLPADDALVRSLEAGPPVISAPALLRRRAVGGTRALLSKLTVLKAELAAGIPARDGIAGVILLGPRRSGSVFTNVEQQALQLLAGQLGIALENARLYTEVHQSKIYNEILLEHLPSGVVAADSRGRITVCNHEACRILRRERSELLGREISRLPPPLSSLLEDVLHSRRVVRDEEISLLQPDREIPLRAAGTLIRDESGKVLSALLIFADQSRVKKLQEQVRRSDRLASVGTLSAGMAHEIKNPLVAIKTFTQLLPERYDDPDFRRTCSELLQKEVQRIDGIVSQLLNFARPRKATSELCRLHSVIRQSLELVQQQFQRRRVTLECRLAAAEDVVRGDPAALEQTFLNFFINALEAMEKGGRLLVATDLYRSRWQPYGGSEAAETHIRVHISDTGPGIAPENLGRIFDPFFTTKEEGTGLGLSVAHEIIKEHDGYVDVKSRPGEGTTFTITFPLAGETVSPDVAPRTS